MGNSIVTSMNSTRRSRRIAFALALAIVPVPGFAQELPAFPPLPAFPSPATDAGSGSASKPMPTPYPFIESLEPADTARIVVKILGLKRSQDGSPIAKQTTPPQLPVQPMTAIAELPRSSVIVSSSAVASAAITLNGAASQSVSPASGAGEPDAQSRYGNNVVVAAAVVSDESSLPNQLGSESGVVAEIGDIEPSLSLIDIDIPLAKPAGEPVPATEPVPALASKSPAARQPTVMQAPQLPLAETVQLEPLPDNADKPIGADTALKLQTMGRVENKKDSNKQNRSTRNQSGSNAIGELAVALTLSEAPVNGDQAARFNLSDSTQSDLTQADKTRVKESRFSLSDRSEAEQYSFSDAQTSGDDAGAEATLGALQTLGSLQLDLVDKNAVPQAPPSVSAPRAYVPRLPAPGKDESWGEPATRIAAGSAPRQLNIAPPPKQSRGSEPKAMRVYVEGEQTVTEPKLAVSSASESQIPVRLSAASIDERPLPSSSLNMRSVPEPVVLSGDRQAESKSNVISAKAIAIEAAPPQLVPPQSSLPPSTSEQISSEMRQGDALVMTAEDAAVRQASEVIRDLSVEHEHICRVIQTGPTTYSVLALQPGVTRIAVITVSVNGKQEVEISEVTVKKIASTGTASDINGLAKQISDSLTQLYPQYVIDVDVLDKSLLVQGEVGSEAEAKRVISLVRKASLVPVIDRLNSPEK